MQWQGRRRSGNVVDKRGARGRGLAVGGGLVGGMVVVEYLLLGGDPRQIAQVLQAEQPHSSAQTGGQLGGKEPGDGGVRLRRPGRHRGRGGKTLPGRWGATTAEQKLVLFTGQVDSGCGFAAAAVGPFYCPGDESLSIDLAFFEDMQRELGACG